MNNLRISLDQDGDGFLWNTMFNDSLLRSATENRWDRHFILINAPNGFAHKTKLFLHWCMLSPSLSLSYFQVDNAYTNPSRLTGIIRIISRADIWYELSLLPVEQNCLREVRQPWQQNSSVKFTIHSTKKKSHSKDKVFHLQINKNVFIYLFFFTNAAHKQTLFEVPALLSQRRQRHSWDSIIYYP